MERRLKKTDKEVKDIKNLLTEHLEGADSRALELKVHIKKTIDEALATVVNGKIDKVHQMLEKQNERSDTFEKKVDAHIAQVEPFIQAKAGLKVLRGFLIWVAGGVLAWAAIKSSFIIK